MSGLSRNTDEQKKDNPFFGPAIDCMSELILAFVAAIEATLEGRSAAQTEPSTSESAQDATAYCIRYLKEFYQEVGIRNKKGRPDYPSNFFGIKSRALLIDGAALTEFGSAEIVETFTSLQNATIESEHDYQLVSILVQFLERVALDKKSPRSLLALGESTQNTVRNMRIEFMHKLEYFAAQKGLTELHATLGITISANTSKNDLQIAIEKIYASTVANNQSHDAALKHEAALTEVRQVGKWFNSIISTTVYAQNIVPDEAVVILAKPALFYTYNGPPTPLDVSSAIASTTDDSSNTETSGTPPAQEAEPSSVATPARTASNDTSPESEYDANVDEKGTAQLLTAHTDSEGTTASAPPPRHLSRVAFESGNTIFVPEFQPVAKPPETPDVSRSSSTSQGLSPETAESPSHAAAPEHPDATSSSKDDHANQQEEETAPLHLEGKLGDSADAATPEPSVSHVQAGAEAAATMPKAINDDKPAPIPGSVSGRTPDQESALMALRALKATLDKEVNSSNPAGTKKSTFFFLAPCSLFCTSSLEDSALRSGRLSVKQDNLAVLTAVEKYLTEAQTRSPGNQNLCHHLKQILAEHPNACKQTFTASRTKAMLATVLRAYMDANNDIQINELIKGWLQNPDRGQSTTEAPRT